MKAFQILSTTALGILFIFTAPIILLMITGDFPGSTAFYNLSEDSDFVAQLLNAREFIGATLTFWK